MRVRTRAPAEVVTPREVERQLVVGGVEVAGVEDLHDVDSVREAFHEVEAGPAVGDAGEGVRDVDQASLLVYLGDGLGQRKAAGQRPRYEHPHRLAVQRVDLLRHDGPGVRPARVMEVHKVRELVGGDELRRGQRAVEGVMVGDREGAQPPPQTGGRYSPRFRAGIVGSRGMDMKVGSDKHGLRSRVLRRAGRYRRSAVFAAIAVCVWLAACSDRAEVYFDEARRLEADYEFERAARRYEVVTAAFKRSPVHDAAAEGLARCRAEMHFNRAEEFIYDGATYTALGEIVAGRRLDADNPRGLYLVGLAHRFIGPRTIALEEADDCIKKYPASPYGYLGRAEYFRFLIEREAALADYVRAFRVAGRDARGRGAAFRGIRDMTLKLGQPERTVTNYEREARGAVRGDAFNYWVGYYYSRKKPIIYRDAQEYFDKVIRGRGPGSYKARAYAGRAECYFFYKDFERARADVDEAIAVDPENDAFYKIAEAIYGELSLPPPRKTQK